MAADRIRVGDADVMFGCGTETMSMVTMLGNKIVLNPAVYDDPKNLGIAMGMGITAEKVAEQWKVSREDQDAFALASHHKALAAIHGGKFRAETTSYPVQSHVPDFASGQVVVTERTVTDDEGVRDDLDMEKLGKLEARVRNQRHGDRRKRFADVGQRRRGAPGLGKNPDPVQAHAARALRQLCRQGRGARDHGHRPHRGDPGCAEARGLKQDDLDWIELNEAFAAQSLAVIRSCNLDAAKVNPLGGAIATGHPLGATGAIKTATLVHALRREKLRYGMVTMCIGHGMGAAGIFEAV